MTGELAPMLGREVVAIRLGELSANFKVWVAEVQGPLYIETGLPVVCLLHARPGEEHAILSWGSHGGNGAIHTGLKTAPTDPESDRDMSWAGPPLPSLAPPLHL